MAYLKFATPASNVKIDEKTKELNIIDENLVGLVVSENVFYTKDDEIKSIYGLLFFKKPLEAQIVTYFSSNDLSFVSLESEDSFFAEESDEEEESIDGDYGEDEDTVIIDSNETIWLF